MASTVGESHLNGIPRAVASTKEGTITRARTREERKERTERAKEGESFIQRLAEFVANTVIGETNAG